MFVLNGQSEEITKLLKPFGLTEYESRVFFALQVLGRSKAGDLWKKSGVPQSKIYYALDCLMLKGLVENTALEPREVEAKPFVRFANEYLLDMKTVLSDLNGRIERYRDLMKNREKFVRVVV